MKLTILLLLIAIAGNLNAQNYQLDVETISIERDGWILQQPWTGGFDDPSPVLVDIDEDGDLDLYLGQKSGFCAIAYFENVGYINNPDLQFIKRDIFLDTLISNFYSYGNSAPTFGDFDGDDDLDILIGGYKGYIAYVENIGTSNVFQFEVIDTFFCEIDVGHESKPSLVDIDADNDLDLFIGAYDINLVNNDGMIFYYRNDGDSVNYDFIFVTDNFEGIDVGSKAAPVFVDIDDDGDYDLFVGEDDGNINFYRNQGTPEVYDFILEEEHFEGIELEDHSSVPCFGDIDGDGDYDLFIGQGEQGSYNDSGGWIYFYENVGDSVNHDFQLVCPNYLSLDVGSQSGAAFGELYQEGVYDLFIGRGKGETFFYRNIGTMDSAYFVYDSTVFSDIFVTYLAKPIFVDIDDDGDQDLFLGREIMMVLTSVHFYRNIGSMGNPILVFEDEIFPGYTSHAYPSLTDIDADGDYDLFIGYLYGMITFFENVGTPEEYRFRHITDSYFDIDVGWHSDPSFCDIDDDGDPDLFIGNTSGNLFFYENVGTPQEADFDSVTSDYIDLWEYGVTTESSPVFVDIDNDGDYDFFCGCGNGGVHFYRNYGTSKVPDFRREFGLNDYKLYQNYPNPFNNSTTITFSLPTYSPVEIAVYDNLGRKIITLINGLQPAGMHQIDWNASGFSSGVYYISLECSEIKRQTRKVILIK